MMPWWYLIVALAAGELVGFLIFLISTDRHRGDDD